MAKTRKEKEVVVARVEALVKNAASAVFVHFRGINVAQETKIRRSFLHEGLGYTVAKKTLIRRALTALNHDHANLPLGGEVAIAYNVDSPDATLPANRIYGYAKEFGLDKIVILGGIFEGKLVDAMTMQEIATIPSLHTLRGMFVNVINSPIQSFVIALDQLAQKNA